MPTSLLRHGDGSRCGGHPFSLPLDLWRRMAEERGIEVVEGLSAFAEPAGPTTRPVYEAFRDEILADIDAAMPLGAVLLFLHGAMIADGYPDAEGDLLRCIRERVGPATKIGAVLDLHMQLSPAKFNNADVLIPFKEYPHIDIPDRAREVFEITLRAAAR